MGSRGDKEVFQLGYIFNVNVMGIVDGSRCKKWRKGKKKKRIKGDD